MCGKISIVSFGQRWADRYRLAWEAGDPDAAAALYAADSVFRSAPFREQERPIDYTRRVFPESSATAVHFGEPVEEGDRAAVEWWATLVTPDGEEQALAGCSILRFGDDGLVVEARDYWHLEPGRREPPPGWGR
jgi:ketosteroid isomerase-like protein